MIEWRQYFPYPETREIQASALDVLFRNWDHYDIFVLSAPTAFGKTAVARTLLTALQSVSVITPTNMLVSQFTDEFPDTRTLSRLDSYTCEEWKRPCSVTRGKLSSFCKGCPAGRDLAQAKYRQGPGVYNYHTYLAHRLFRKVLIVDEAHNLIPVLQDRFSLTMWQHDYKYPGSMFRPEQMQEWLGKQRKGGKKIEILRECLESKSPEYVPARRKKEFNGKGTIRGQPEDRDCLQLTPVDISGMPPVFWPREVEKIVLMSATISPQDVATLGLDRKKVLYINCESPIEAARRPIVQDPQFYLRKENMEENSLKLANYIREVAGHHPGEKGVVHATYQLSRMLAPELENNSRFIFHDREDKKDRYKEFRDSPAEEGKVLIACGMYEGIDLPEDLGRWQIVAKIPWPSLGDAGIRYRAEQDPEWYLWETWKIVMQACGRICRTPQDNGVTIIPDSSFQRLLREGIHMIPEWFRDGINEGKKYVG